MQDGEETEQRLGVRKELSMYWGFARSLVWQENGIQEGYRRQ